MQEGWEREWRRSRRPATANLSADLLMYIYIVVAQTTLTNIYIYIYVINDLIILITLLVTYYYIILFILYSYSDKLESRCVLSVQKLLDTSHRAGGTSSLPFRRPWASWKSPKTGRP